MTSNFTIPVILCGGQGTRLWPLSRRSFPKQYLSINSEEKNSLLQKTLKRIANLRNLMNPILICNEEHRFIAAEQMREIGVKTTSILLEPFGRNTGPAIALAAFIALQKEEDPTLLVLSSDHEILDDRKFINAIETGINYANNNRVVTFGVIPTSPETGYGYIKGQSELNVESNNGVNILEFTEKPNIETAKKFIDDKRYSWNSGIFAFKAKTIIDELNKFSPEIIECCKGAISELKEDLDFQRIDKNTFQKCPDISIDIAVLEKTKLGTVVPMDAGWSDIGNWNSVWNFSKKDANNNRIEGNAIIKNSNNCYLRSENKLAVGIGLNDLIIVDTNDALLVANHKESQNIKGIVKELKEKGISQGQIHRKVCRPWGYYESLVEDLLWQVKLIFVKSGEKLSLQLHHHRSEHWIVVSGTARVEVDEKLLILSENQSTYIPVGSKHRLTNPGKIPLILIEVQSGSYIGEDDIVRFEDKYGR